MLVEGLVPGVVVGGGVVEFVPANCVAPAGDDGGGLVVLRGLLPGVFEVCVGGHGGEDAGCWLRCCGRRQGLSRHQDDARSRPVRQASLV